MATSIQSSIVSQAEGQGYQFIEAEEDRLFFSLDGTKNHSDRAALENLDLGDEPPDFIALSTDFYYYGPIATGWKSGSMMLMRFTENGLSYKAMTEEERRALEDRFRTPPTAEEFAEMDAQAHKVLEIMKV